MIGELLDHYRVLELVGRGAMGVVYKGLDVNLDRAVAIKVMSAEARNDPDFVERFRQEARVQGALNHPNVAMLFDYFVHDGAPVAVMEFIDGESFEQLIRRRGAIPAHESMPIFKQALQGVAAAHRAGIVHRDLKPSNLMVTRDHIVKVMDFGIAKRQGVTGATKVSTSIGSPLYMAPEQILGRPVDCRTDIYSLGTTLYELLSGQRPFNPRGKAEYWVLNAHVNDLPDPPNVHCRDIPQPIADAVMRALAKDPAARFQSADDFARALPDVPAPPRAAPAPRVGPTGTIVLGSAPASAAGAGPTGTLKLESTPNMPTPAVGPTGTLVLGSAPNNAAAQAGRTGTVAVEYSPPKSADPPLPAPGPDATTVFEYAPTGRRDRRETVAFDYSAGTLRRGLDTTTPSLPAAAPSSGVMRRSRAFWPAAAGVLVAALALAMLSRHARQGHATVQAPALAAGAPSAIPAQTPRTPTSIPTEAAVPPAASVSSLAEPLMPPPEDVPPPAAEPATDAPLAAAPRPARRDLAGIWRGEYLDASGKQLLRVVGLNISRVRDDGGIEGTLQYEAASGEGECRLHPRGSTYSAGKKRLQLSPEGCSPHHPRELGVPLDFDGVNPSANMLRDGRIEAPTGEVIRVKLRRVS